MTASSRQRASGLHAGSQTASKDSACAQVHVDCSPQQLLEHLQSSNAAEADAAAICIVQGRAVREDALEAARQALGAAQILCVCAEAEHEAVVAAAHRLQQHAASISSSLNMKGTLPTMRHQVIKNTWRYRIADISCLKFLFRSFPSQSPPSDAWS